MHLKSNLSAVLALARMGCLLACCRPLVAVCKAFVSHFLVDGFGCIGHGARRSRAPARSALTSNTDT